MPIAGRVMSMVARQVGGENYVKNHPGPVSAPVYRGGIAGVAAPIMSGQAMAYTKQQKGQKPITIGDAITSKSGVKYV